MFLKTIFVVLFFSINLLGNITINEKIQQFNLEDQFDKVHQIKSDTKKLIFAFSKDIGHNVNDFLEKQDSKYLANKNAQFIIDLSGAPSIIRSFFIIPKLEKYSYSVLIIKDDEVSKKYIDEKNIDKVMVVTLDDLNVKSVDFFKTTNELKTFLEN